MIGPAGAARSLMDRFSAATGLTSEAAQRRYLWTDAFAVCNWLALGEVGRAETLIEIVHGTLGRHRPDDSRDGWISGLPDDEGEERPTAGGLRIGKPLPERSPEEPYDPQLEWERDGQYFHYLTRWIRALHRAEEATGEARYREWAVELGRVAFDRFSHGIGPVPNRLYWKMSIDLTRPLVPSMGQHDALDGFVVLSELGRRENDTLGDAIDGLSGMAEDGEWATDDALGAGALLADALTLTRLGPSTDRVRTRVLNRVIDAAARSVRDVRATRVTELPAAQRLPFRELGLAIGLAGVEALDETLPTAEYGETLASLRSALPLRDAIVDFWLDDENRRGPTWTAHDDINTVMLATALVPERYLGLEAPSD